MESSGASIGTMLLFGCWRHCIRMRRPRWWALSLSRI